MEEEKKVYGSSILETNANTEPEDEFAFDEDIMSDKEIEEERQSMKNDLENFKAKKITSTDAISGVTSSSDDDIDDYEKLSEIIDEQDIRGKTIANSGKTMIKDLLKEDVNEEYLANISKAFEKWSESATNIEDADISEVEFALGDKISDKLKSITTEEDYESVAKRFAIQLYSTYSNVVQFNDDMKELSRLTRKVDAYSKSMNDTENEYKEGDVIDIDKEFKNLQTIQSDIAEFMEKMKKLDDRNSRLKQDYTLDDYDIRTVESVKKCLDTALSFEKVYKKIDNSFNLLKKEISKDKIVDRSIENWVNDIKNDQYTLFTFPVNDFLSVAETRKQITEFFYNTLVIDHTLKTGIAIPDNVTDLERYLVDSGELSPEENRKFRLQTRLVLYLLSRTFKHKKLETNDDRRVLSYTLDMISKLGVKDHRDRFVKLADYSYNLVYNK
jgi:hypothetical protein